MPIGESWSDRVAHRRDHLDQEPRAVLQRATPIVVAPVGERAEELRDQIAVRGVQRDTGEACPLHLCRGEGELVDGVPNLGLGHRLWPGEVQARFTDDVDVDVGGRQRRAVDLAADLAPGVAQLGPEVRALRPSCLGQPGQLGTSGLVVDDDVVRPLQVSAVHLDVAREQQPGPRARPAPVERFQPGRGVVGGIGEALAHRRLGEAVGQRRPGGQDQWPVEGMGHDDSVSATLNV